MGGPRATGVNPPERMHIPSTMKNPPCLSHCLDRSRKVEKHVFYQAGFSAVHFKIWGRANMPSLFSTGFCGCSCVFEQMSNKVKFHPAHSPMTSTDFNPRETSASPSGDVTPGDRLPPSGCKERAQPGDMFDVTLRLGDRGFPGIWWASPCPGKTPSKLSANQRVNTEKARTRLNKTSSLKSSEGEISVQTVHSKSVSLSLSLFVGDI